MIAYISGKLTYKTPTTVYLDVNGVGYDINISLHTYSQIEEKDEAKLWTYLHVREDAQILYGFSELAEKKMFSHLISVSGIGANTARLILSSMHYAEVQSAIANEAVVSLNKIKGVGPKTAKRIILDLKDKMIKESMDSADTLIVSSNSAKNDALSALLALGFNKNKVIPVLNKIYKPDMSVEETIKIALSQVSK